MTYQCVVEQTSIGTLTAADILVIDDDEISGVLLTRRLQHQGHDVRYIQDSREALAVLASSNFDLVLLDIMMPEIDGMEILRFIRERWDVTSLPVIMVTARDESHDVVTALEAGANDYLTKPLDMPVVNARIRTQLLLKQSVSALEEANHQLVRLSTMDGLTNVANRRYFDERLEQAIKVASRTKAPLSLLLADVNQFKKLNDTYGHLLGDEALKVIAHTLQENIPRRTDLVARYGGDEFAVILQATDSDGAAQVIEQLRAAVNTLTVTDERTGEAIFLSACFGAGTIYPGPSTEAEELITLADHAMYLEKEVRSRTLQGGIR